MKYDFQQYRLGYPVIDMHTHLRNDMEYHTKILKDNGMDVVVCMANTKPPLDSLEEIEKYMSRPRHCQVIPVSAITKNQEGKELVDVENIKSHVVGFSDDGKYLEDLGLLREILQMNVLVLPHCCPPYDVAVEHPELQVKYLYSYLDTYLNTCAKVGNAFLHIQHVSRKEEVEMIREAKKSHRDLTCETCPHYFTWSRKDLDKKVNPPLASRRDVQAVRDGLADGTIDVIASDYAPLPRITGIAAPDLFIPISRGLVLQGVLSEEQLKEKLFTNPKMIIKSTGYKLNL
jgi:dihydroorotase